jgi:hypothetical protein
MIWQGSHLRYGLKAEHHVNNQHHRPRSLPAATRHTYVCFENNGSDSSSDSHPEFMTLAPLAYSSSAKMSDETVQDRIPDLRTSVIARLGHLLHCSRYPIKQRRNDWAACRLRFQQHSGISIDAEIWREIPLSESRVLPRTRRCKAYFKATMNPVLIYNGALNLQSIECIAEHLSRSIEPSNRFRVGSGLKR